jgi:acetyltransferase
MCNDRQIALPPLNDYLARELIEGSRAFAPGAHFKSLPEADIEKLVESLRRVSEMACELPEIQTLDIDPLLIDERGATTVEARITVAAPRSATGRYCHMAIHPYPPGLETNWQLDEDTTVLIRPIRPEDANTERAFVDNLSSESKYFRFMNHMDKISPLMLARFTQIDYDREMALVAMLGEHTEQARMIGVARYISNPDELSCEFALTVADDWQKRGLGRQLMERLIAIAGDRGLQVMEGDVLAQNSKMLRLCNSLGFHTVHDSEDPEVVIVRRDI